MSTSEEKPKAEPRKVTTISIPETLWEEVSIMATRQRTTLNDITITALREFVASQQQAA